MELEEKAKALIESVKAQTTPGNRSLDISVFVSQGLRGKELNLYEAYLLSGIKMEFTRFSYVQPAWSNRVRISILLELLNLRLLAAVFEEKSEEVRWTGYAKEAYSMNQERRPHYILDHYQEYLGETISSEFLQSLKDVRASRSKPFDNGPYHTDVFPYNKCKCEELLLQGKTLPRRNKKICSAIENLLVELVLILDE
ncbi:MAG: hypothetical protein K2O06_08525 [Acetatifactor sp.]|nr:hypothetical protein [Acetatifactor sp.]